MAKKDIVRFAIDTNVVGFLALASQSKEKFFYYYPKATKDVYDGLVWLYKMLERGKIELVVPYVAFHELIKNNSANHISQKNLTAQQIAKFESKRRFRSFAKQFIRETPGMKIAFMEGGHIGEYNKKVIQLATEYSQPPEFPENLDLSNYIKQKPFLMNGDVPSNDARIMAEATLLGLNLITFDKHFLNKKPFNIPNAIYKLNMEKFESPVRPVSFLSLINAMKRENTTLPYFKRTFKNKTFPNFVNFELLTHAEYGKMIDEVMASKREYSQNLENVATLRTLFLKYLQNPLCLDELESAPEILPQVEQNQPVQNVQPAKQEKSQSPQPKPQTPSAPKKKIKFDLSGGQDFDGFAKYLDNQQSDDQLEK